MTDQSAKDSKRMNYLRNGLSKMYPEMRLYGIYRDKSGRGYIRLYELTDGQVRRGAKSISMTLARALMTVKLGRRLEVWEEVDHKDHDPANDSWRNLQVLTVVEHRRKSAIEATIYRTTAAKLVCCPVCGKKFRCAGNRLRALNKDGKQPCCSIVCANRIRAKPFSRKRST